jgi:hypothetical protein
VNLADIFPIALITGATGLLTAAGIIIWWIRTDQWAESGRPPHPGYRGPITIPYTRQRWQPRHALTTPAKPAPAFLDQPGSEPGTFADIPGLPPIPAATIPVTTGTTAGSRPGTTAGTTAIRSLLTHRAARLRVPLGRPVKPLHPIVVAQLGYPTVDACIAAIFGSHPDA